LNKGLVASLALEWFFACVGTFVNLESCILTKGLAASLALEWPFAGVGVHVSVKTVSSLYRLGDV